MELRETFDRQALLYDRARPHYPSQLIDKLIEVTNIKPSDNLLEIGPGTGQATQPLAVRGYRITGVELGGHLAQVARYKLRSYPKVKIITASFEDAELPAHSYRLIYSATAFHWIRPDVKFARTHQLLNSSGYLAIIHTHHISDEQGDKFHAAAQLIYDRYWPPQTDPPLLPKLADLKPPVLDNNLFQLVHFQSFPITIGYTAQQYSDLLHTYSPTLALPGDKQAAFLEEIRNLIMHGFDGVHEKHFGMSLTVARAI